MVIVWDAGTGEALSSVELPDIPLCASWNKNGSSVVTSCKDKKVRILDPRAGTIVKVLYIAGFSIAVSVLVSQISVRTRGRHTYSGRVT